MRTLAALAVISLSLGPATAQSEVSLPPTFDDVVEVRVVNVDVFVRDRSGEPIIGLRAEDFRLFEDGVEVPVSHFEAFSVQAPRVAEEAPLPAATPEGIEPEVMPAEEPLRVVVFLDNESLVKAERARLLSGLGELRNAYDLGEVRFAVVTHDGKLEALTGFTRDFDEIEEAFGRVGKTSAKGIDAVSDYRRSLNAIRSVMEGFAQTDCSPCECGWDNMTQIWEGYAQRSGARGYRSAMALSQLTDSLAAMPGRKAVVWASAGLQQRPGLSLAQYLVDLCPDPRNELDLLTDRTDRYNASKILAAVAARANAARVTFYALGALGAAPVPSASVDSSPFLRPSMTTAGESIRNRRDGLRAVAETTGGRELSKAESVIESLAADSRNFYSLAFSPAAPPDGEVHQIRVELREPPKGVDLRFRQSYRDRPPLERLADRVMGALWFGTTENALAVEARFGPQTPIAEEVNVPLGILVPTSEMTAREDASGPSAYLRLVIASRDADGKVSPARQKLIPHMIRVDLQLAPGSHQVAFALRDEASRHQSVMRLALEVPAGRQQR
jgi:VWFA-related protein